MLPILCLIGANPIAYLPKLKLILYICELYITKLGKITLKL